MNLSNIYKRRSEVLDKELFETILETAAFKLERIVSPGQATAAGEWYDQDWDEWVILLSGRARLRIEGEGRLIELAPGDYLHLPAHLRHRVEWTTPEEDTVWLALHYRPPAAAQ